MLELCIERIFRQGPASLSFCFSVFLFLGTLAFKTAVILHSRRYENLRPLLQR